MTNTALDYPGVGKRGETRTPLLVDRVYGIVDGNRRIRSRHTRFSGTPLDYQLREEEDESGFTRFNLLVSPRLLIPNEAAVVEAVPEGLNPRLRAYWREAGKIRIKRMEPSRKDAAS